MECKAYREQITSLLNDTLSQPERADIENHLLGCNDCMEEFEATRKIWELMGEIPQPEPSESVKSGFYAILNKHKEEEEAVNKNLFSDFISRFTGFWTRQLQPGMAYSFLLVAAGLTAGYLLHRPKQSEESFNKQIDSLSSQVSEIKQVLMLSLLGDESASQRIRAVSYTDEMSNVDLKVISALFTTLNEDPNVNVRLATLEALVKLSGEPKVREGLVKSIELQDSPMMQSAIADAMVRLQEKSSVKSLQNLLNKKDLNQIVKTNIQKSIQQLI